MRRTGFALLLFGLSAAAVLTPPAAAQDKGAPARAKALESKDEGKFFGEAAWKRVAPAADKLFREKGLDFVVETFDAPKDADKVATMKPPEREKFFKELAEARGRELKLDGIYILVSRKPGTLYVYDSDPNDFPPGFATKLKGALLASFKDGKYDDGLNKVIDLVQEAKVGDKKGGRERRLVAAAADLHAAAAGVSAAAEKADRAAAALAVVFESKDDEATKAKKLTDLRAEMAAARKDLDAARAKADALAAEVKSLQADAKEAGKK